MARLVWGRVAMVNVRGLKMEQEIYIGRYTSRSATTAQKAFWEFVTDPNNPVLHQLNAIDDTGDWSTFPTIGEGNGELAPLV